MRKVIVLFAAAGASLAVAAPAQAGVRTIVECTDNPTGSVDRPREIRQCVSYDVNSSLAQLQTCDDGLFGNPESIGEFRDCVVATLLD